MFMDNNKPIKIRHISLNTDVLVGKGETASHESVVAAFSERVNKVVLDLASKEPNAHGVRLLEVKIDGEKASFKVDDPDNLVNHVLLDLSASAPGAEIEIHHTAERT